jgi:transcriptional regulator with XRE-family HTH domain
MSTTTHPRNFAYRLKQLRAAAGLSQPALAAAAAVSLGSLRGWELGRHEPGLSALLRLAGGLGVELNAFAMEAGPGRKPRRRKAKLLRRNAP